MSKITRASLGLTFLIGLTLLLPSGCPAAGQASAATTGKTRIEKASDAAAILGAPQRERRLGEPAALTAAQKQSIAAVHTEPGDLPHLSVAIDGKSLDLPLDHTHVSATIVGDTARVEVTQTYQNPFTYPIEAVYIFPLPENSAVDDMKMIIGERIIQAEIQKRAEARQTYETAKRQGHTAALLEQERPNVFTQSVANIEPGSKIDVVLRYAQDLTYDAGEYEFVFPMVVGPRFIPGAPTGGRSGLGWAEDTQQVPDASRITPPILGGGMRSGHDISLELRADAGMPITTWEVPTHDIEETPTIDGTLKLRLSKSDAIPNRDFVLKYHVDGERPQAAVLAHRQANGDGYFSLVVQPPKLDVEALVGQRELVFVIDISGSMSGVPLAMCKDAMQSALGKLRPVDTFEVVTFESGTRRLFGKPRPANDTNLKAALSFVDGLTAGGGTMMSLGVQEALTPDIEPGRNRYVFFMTDGYIGNEAEIMAGTRKLVDALERSGQKARVFSFGTGSSTNRMLLDGIARAGRGSAVYSSTREDPTLAVDKFFGTINHPVLSDIAIDWGGLAVSDVQPAVLPELFASRPLVLHGRFSGATPRSGSITLKARAAGRAIEIPARISLDAVGDSANGAARLAASADHALVSSLWARAKIDTLERDLIYNGQSAQTIDAITALGLQHHLVTAFTSFVAVDKSHVVNGKLQTVLVPVEAPEGVDPKMAGGEVLESLSRTTSGGSAYATPTSPAPTTVLNSYGSVGATKTDKSGGYGSGYGVADGIFREAQGGASLGGSVSSQSYRGRGQAPAAEVKRKAHKHSESEKTMDADKPAPPPSNKPEPSPKDEEATSELLVSNAAMTNAVRALLASRRSAFATCHAETLGSGGRHGIVELRWFVAADGNVLQLKVTGGSLRHPELEKRLLTLLAGLHFPTAGDARPYEVRWRLSCSHADAIGNPR